MKGHVAAAWKKSGQSAANLPPMEPIIDALSGGNIVFIAIQVQYHKIVNKFSNTSKTAGQGYILLNLLYFKQVRAWKIRRQSAAKK